MVDTFKLNVIPFSLNDTPDSFTGAVGQYAMVSSVDKRSMTTDQALIITMKVQGNGDIKRVQAPKLGLGDDFELYEPTISGEKTFENKGQLLGEKIFEYQALPLRPGQYTICLLYTSPSPRDATLSRMPSSA